MIPRKGDIDKAAYREEARDMLLLKIPSSFWIEIGPNFLERTHLMSADVFDLSVILEDKREVLDDSSEYQVDEEICNPAMKSVLSLAGEASYFRNVHIERTFQMIKRAYAQALEPQSDSR